MRHAFLLLLLLIGGSAQAQTQLGLRLGGTLAHLQAVDNPIYHLQR
ncbi:MAG: hypothetical protein ACRYFX_22050 [Janthinobacterium lividum]